MWTVPGGGHPASVQASPTSCANRPGPSTPPPICYVIPRPREGSQAPVSRHGIHRRSPPSNFRECKGYSLPYPEGMGWDEADALPEGSQAPASRAAVHPHPTSGSVRGTTLKERAGMRLTLPPVPTPDHSPSPARDLKEDMAFTAVLQLPFPEGMGWEYALPSHQYQTRGKHLPRISRGGKGDRPSNTPAKLSWPLFFSSPPLPQWP